MRLGCWQLTSIISTKGTPTVKTLIKRAFNSVGLEIRKLKAPEPDGELPQDEVVSGPWETHALQMANLNYRPHTLRYHRTKYGDDQRLKYMAYFLDLRGLRILELGPYEGHHSVVLEKMGVRENIAVESRQENLQKCLRIKQKYGLDRTTFVLGDIEDFYNGAERPTFNGPFDLVFCLGVLYHVPDPGKALAWFRSQAKKLFLGTHYPGHSSPPDAKTYLHAGKSYRVSESPEGGIADPISGMSPVSLLPYVSDLLRLLHDVGYDRVSVLGHDVQNGGPHVTILAE
jgi:hypothetical protein